MAGVDAGVPLVEIKELAGLPEDTNDTRLVETVNEGAPLVVPEGHPKLLRLEEVVLDDGGDRLPDEPVTGADAAEDPDRIDDKEADSVTPEEVVPTKANDVLETLELDVAFKLDRVELKIADELALKLALDVILERSEDSSEEELSVLLEDDDTLAGGTRVLKTLEGARLGSPLLMPLETRGDEVGTKLGVLLGVEPKELEDADEGVTPGVDMVAGVDGVVIVEDMIEVLGSVGRPDDASAVDTTGDDEVAIELGDADVPEPTGEDKLGREVEVKALVIPLDKLGEVPNGGAEVTELTTGTVKDEGKVDADNAGLAALGSDAEEGAETGTDVVPGELPGVVRPEDIGVIVFVIDEGAAIEAGLLSAMEGLSSGSVPKVLRGWLMGLDGAEAMPPEDTANEEEGVEMGGELVIGGLGVIRVV
jgi:hypothetical protein